MSLEEKTITYKGRVVFVKLSVPFFSRTLKSYVENEACFMFVNTGSVNMSYSIEKGAKRFVEGINNPKFKSGVFYGNKEQVWTGYVINQSSIWNGLDNAAFQNNADIAIHKFI